jgi:L-ascorbate metabolism protein UlaG (beta-lactamase superfamily)
MKIKWYGHAAFRLQDAKGFSVITDPYTPEEIGYEPIADGADVVVVSSDNDSAHCRSDLIPGNPTVINALEVARAGGVRTVAGFEVRAVQAMEILNHPLHDPDQNGMYRFELDGLRIAHMGDVGNPLTESQTRFFDDVDVLLALTGDQFTIALDELKRVIDETKPKIVIPMHFRTLTYKPRNTFWIQSFLDYFDDGDVDFAFGYEAEITKDTLSAETRVLVMDYVR